MTQRTGKHSLRDLKVGWIPFTMIFHHKGDQSKIRLLICKLDTKWHDRYKDYILPKQTTFTKAMKPISEVLREKQSLFTIQFKCKLKKR